MKPGLFVLPFLALLLGALFIAVGSSFPELGYLKGIGGGISALLLFLWVALDFENFKAMFSRKGAKYGASSGGVVILGVLVICGIAALTSKPRFNKSVDVTRDGINTLSEQSKKIIAGTVEKNQRIAVTAFFTEEEVKGKFKDALDLYLKDGGIFDIEYVDPQTDPTRAMAAKLTAGNTVIFKYQTQEARITSFTEEKITNALVNVLKSKTKKVYFTKGHGEGQVKGTEANGFSVATQELENNKYEVHELDLLQTAKVPEDADLVIIAGPKYDFKKEEIRFLEDFLRRGGALLSMVDALNQIPSLNGLLKEYGLAYNSDLLILPPDDIRAQLIGQNSAIVSEFDDFSPVTKDFSSQSQVALLLQNTRSVEGFEDNPQKMNVVVAGKTSDIMIKVKDVNTASDLENLTEDRWEIGSHGVIGVANGKLGPPMTADSSDVAGASGGGQEGVSDKADVTAQKGELASQRETRIVTVGSVQFANNGGAQTPEHRDMFLNITNYLLQDEDFISIRPKDPTKSTINLTSSSSQMLLLMLSFIYPFVYLGGGTVYWLKRRRA
jgi:ABC-type uncharacterized transport system involved in gliding motility auxiliary subunit